MSKDDVEIANRIIRPSLIGHTVTRVLLDASVTLQFAPPAPGAELRLGHRFRISSSDGTEFEIDPENLGRQAEYAAGLFLAEVADVNVTQGFVLEVRFADGTTLTAPPDDAYEIMAIQRPPQGTHRLPGGTARPRDLVSTCRVARGALDDDGYDRPIVR